MPAKQGIAFNIDDNGCFNCISHAPCGGGYVMIRMHGKRRSMHRHVYEECYGEIPVGMLIRHSCDNPKCINPEHLLLGTVMDNTRDKIERGRQAKGTDFPNAKLTQSDVIAIRNDTKSYHKDLAAKYGISRVKITKIKNRQNWTHV